MKRRSTMNEARVPILAGILLLSILGPGAVPAAGEAGAAAEVESLRQELKQLRADYETKIQRLEEAIKRLEQQQAGTAAPPPPAPRAEVQGRSVGNEMNPRISVIGNFLSRYQDAEAAGSARDLDFSLSELEIAFQSEIDPYLKFDVFAAFHEHSDVSIIPWTAGSVIPLDHGDVPEGDHEHGEEGHGGLEAELEEAYVTSLGLPGGLQLRAGKYRQKVGRANMVHPHAQPWADQPTVSLAYFGGDQLIDTGVELNWLLPTPFFWELSGSIGRGPDESPSFVRAESDDFLWVVRNKFFWDINRATSLEFGQNWLQGPGSHDGTALSTIWGADLTLKWVPSTYRRIVWQTEAFRRSLPIGLLEEDGDAAMSALAQATGEGDDHHLSYEVMDDWGAYTHFEYRLARRWYIGLRFDYLDYDDAFFEPGVDARWDISAIGQFWPSEFQTVRFQYKRTEDDLLDDPLDTLYLQWVWVMGSHGAHSF